MVLRDESVHNTAALAILSVPEFKEDLFLELFYLNPIPEMYLYNALHFFNQPFVLFNFIIV